MQLRIAILVASVVVSVTSSVIADQKIEFNRDVRPILSNNCYLCHGPDKNQLQAGLRLDKRDIATEKLESGQTAIIPHDVAASVLVARITSTDPNQKMPPADSGKSLTAAEIDILKQWIAQGAEYQGHWSFIPAVRRDAPATRHTDLVRNEIDKFILSRLESAGLEPSPKRTRSR